MRTAQPWRRHIVVSGHLVMHADAAAEEVDTGRAVAEVARYEAAERRMRPLAADVLRRLYGLRVERRGHGEVCCELRLSGEEVDLLEREALGEVFRAFGLRRP
jgi:hypothetical protein